MSTNVDRAGHTRAVRRVECSCRGSQSSAMPATAAQPRPAQARRPLIWRQLGTKTERPVANATTASLSPGTRKPASGGPSPAERTDQRVVTGRVREFADEHSNPQSAHSLASRSRLDRTRRQGNEPSALPPRIRGCDYGSWHGRQNLSQKHVGMIVRQLEGAGFDCDTVRRDLNAQSLRATTFVRKAITPPAVIGAIAGSPKES